MAGLGELLDRVRAAPRGPAVAAFFDLDATVLASSPDPDGTAARRRGAVERLAAGWAGLTEAEARLSSGRAAAGPRVRREIGELAAAHGEMGHTLVLVSSGTRVQAEPAARELGVHYLLCTQLAVRQGRLTGELIGGPLDGARAALAARRLATGCDLPLSLPDSFAYGDAASDLPLLEAVGHPTLITPGRELRHAAGARGWPVLGEPGRIASAAATAAGVARTGLFHGSIAAAIGAGAALRQIGGSEADRVAVRGGLGSDVGLRAAGVRVDVVRGVEHLWAARPCVFAFNHPSRLDPAVVMHLLRRDVVAEPARERATATMFWRLLGSGGRPFVDPSGPSLVIAPEPTLSPAGGLGPFRPDAVRIAIGAGVPIVPIVVRGTARLLPPGARLIAPGTVEVAVLPPLDTLAWRLEDLDAHVAELRRAFLDALARWPGRPCGPTLASRAKQADPAIRPSEGRDAPVAGRR